MLSAFDAPLTNPLAFLGQHVCRDWVEVLQWVVGGYRVIRRCGWCGRDAGSWLVSEEPC